MMNASTRTALNTRATIWVRRLFVALVIAVLSAAMTALVVWLGSMKRWWADALVTYVSLLMVNGAMIGAYAGWALDEVDEPQEERRLMLAFGLIGVVLPLLEVLVKQALAVPFDVTPGNWPTWADAVARAMVSILSYILAVALVIGMARTARKAAVWITGALFVLALMLLAALPWLGSHDLGAGRVCLGLFTVAVLFAKTIQRRERAVFVNVSARASPSAD